MRKLLVALCCLEILYITFLVNTAGPFVSPIILFGLSLGIAVCYLRMVSRPQPLVAAGMLPPQWLRVGQWVLFAACSYLVFSKLKHFWWYDKTYGDPSSSSDIIPQIHTLVTRLLAGQQPYSLISFGSYSLFPTYMPFQWLPYLLTEFVQKDYRWIPAFAMWAMCVYYFLCHRRALGASPWGLLLPVWPLLVWGEFMMHDNRIFVYTVEGLIAAYYFFVAEATQWRRVWPLAVGIGICLLSRYSIIFWVPLCAFFFFTSGQRRQLFAVMLIPFVMILVFYVLPFLSRDASIFLQGYEYHTKAAYYEWARDLQVFGGKVYVRNGLGFSAYALQFFPGDVNSQLLLYKKVHLAACILSVVLLGWYYMRHRHRYELRPYMLFSFKVYITVFYAFIQIPYKYLFFVPMVVSAAVMAAALSVKNNRIPQNDDGQSAITPS